MPSSGGNRDRAERVALLLRVSSEEQRETIEIQREFLQEYCRLYSLEVAQVYADDGVLGTIPLHERPEGRRLLEDANGGKFSTVLVYRLDRLGRSLLVTVDAHDRLQDCGVALKSATEPIDTSNPSGRLLKNPGEVLERLREQHDAGELEARRKELAKHLAAKQVEKARYVRAYAQGHISEELDAYLAELKKQTDT